MTSRPLAATTTSSDVLPCVHPNAAGVDIGADEIYVCVPSDRDAHPVRAFATFTADLHALADWLVACRIDTVAMESTGIYWLAIYEILEARGIRVFLVNARQIKIPPGRKSDWKDCQWIQRLHTLGLLQASFRPDAEMALLRAYLRHRAELIGHRAPHILHMQKALHQMNIQLDRVLSDITGTTGMAIVRAIVAGERDPLVLAQLRNPGCKSSEEKLAKAMEGTWQAPYLFVMGQALELYDFYTEQLAHCDSEIERYYGALKPRFESEVDPTSLRAAKPGSKSKNKPNFNARAELARVMGVDLVAVSGLSASSVQTIIAEIGTDMSTFPTVKHFGSWLGLAPHNDISGGRVVRSRTRKEEAFRVGALPLRARSDSRLGAPRGTRPALGSALLLSKYNRRISIASDASFLPLIYVQRSVNRNTDRPERLTPGCHIADWETRCDKDTVILVVADRHHFVEPKATNLDMANACNRNPCERQKGFEDRCREVVGGQSKMHHTPPRPDLFIDKCIIDHRLLNS